MKLMVDLKVGHIYTMTFWKSIVMLCTYESTKQVFTCHKLNSSALCSKYG